MRARDGEPRRERNERGGDFRDALQPTEELLERPVGRAEQVALAVRAPLHRSVEGSRGVARVNEAQPAFGHGRDFTSEEVEHDLRRTQTLVAGAQEQTRVHDDEPTVFARKVFERDSFLVELAGVVGPARDDVERRGPVLVGHNVARVRHGDCPARRGQND